MNYKPTPRVNSLLAKPVEQDTWHADATQACRETVGFIDSLLREADGDTSACLAAVRNSLNWVVNEPASANEVRMTVARALEIFRKVGVQAPSSLALAGQS